MVTVHALLEVGEAPDPWCLCMFTVHALLEVGEAPDPWCLCMVTVHALLEVGEAPDPWCLCMFTVHALPEVGEPRVLGVGAWSRWKHGWEWAGHSSPSVLHMKSVSLVSAVL
ncbi:hypothetical protein NDU88_000026 [Pleurodeles waltl]|uniref:Uncharacterized protein n=1 Tax=Pleurodeles waltl TaxID=8319 RepID=A0AAV7KPL8_PLEWA|nr:hypothetical protein NDU88_000026 [Pleurodeles waltl]